MAQRERQMLAVASGFVGLLVVVLLYSCGGGGGKSSPSQVVGGGGGGELTIAIASANPIQGQEPLRVNFLVTVSGGTPPFDYFWDFDFDPESPNNAFDFTDPDSGSRTSTASFVYRVRASDAARGFSEYLARVVVVDTNGNQVSTLIPRVPEGLPQPMIVVSSQPSLIFEELSAFSEEVLPGGQFVFRVGKPITFTARVVGGTPPFTFAWDFESDGQIDSVLPQPRFIYSTPGQKNVTVTVTDDSGQSAVSTLGLNVLPAEGAVPDVVPFADEAVVVNSNPALQIGQGRTFTTATAFVTLLPQEEVQLGQNVLEIAANVNPNLTEVDLPGDPQQNDLNGDGDLNDSISGVPPYEFLWDFTSDGVVDFIGLAPSIPLNRNGRPFNPYALPGDYLLTLKVKDQQGLIVVKRIEIRVGLPEPFQVQLSVTDNPFNPEGMDLFNPFEGPVGALIDSNGDGLRDSYALAGGLQGPVATRLVYLLQDDDLDQQATAWTKVTPMITSRGEAGGINLGLDLNGDGNADSDGIFVFGGRNEFGGALNLVEVYVAANDQWLNLSPMMQNGSPVKLFGHEVYFGPNFGFPGQAPTGGFLIIGGATDPDIGVDGFVNNQILLYSLGAPPTNNTVGVASLPTPRVRMASAQILLSPEIIGNNLFFPTRIITAGGQILSGDPVATVEMIEVHNHSGVVTYNVESLPSLPVKLAGAEAVPTDIVTIRKDDIDQNGVRELVAHFIEGVTVMGGFTQDALGNIVPQDDVYFFALHEFDIGIDPDFNITGPIGPIQPIKQWVKLNVTMNRARYNFAAIPVGAVVREAFDPNSDPDPPPVPAEAPITAPQGQNVVILAGVDKTNRIDQAEVLKINP